MANEPIALSKNLVKKNIVFPAVISEKVDGIAVRMNYNGNLTRQSTVLKSIPHLDNFFKSVFQQDTRVLAVGELFVEYGMPFKKASGIIRSHVPSNDIKLMLYDFSYVGKQEEYEQRYENLLNFVEWAEQYTDKIHAPRHASICHNWNDVEGTFEKIKAHAHSEGYYPEGYMLRMLRGEHTYFAAGKRSWGMQRFKDKPTIDLKVVGMVEATANKFIQFLGECYEPGDKLNAIGSLIVEINGEEIGVGPGKLTHKQRRHYFENPDEIINKIIEIQYMRDDSYDALREATFNRLRLDKTEPDTLNTGEI